MVQFIVQEWGNVKAYKNKMQVQTHKKPVNNNKQVNIYLQFEVQGADINHVSPPQKAFSVVLCSSFNVEKMTQFWQKHLLLQQPC